MPVYLLKENVDDRACLPKENPIRDSCFWTSGQRVNETCQSSFVWKPSSGKSLPLTFEAWMDGEPNCEGGTEFCLDLHGGFGFAWNDVPCNAERCALCEYKP